MASLLAGLLEAGCSVVGIRTVAEPAYTVERELGRVEIRDYGPRVAAETVVRAGELEARSVGFRRLAGYIFGGNRAEERIAMTAPVAQSGQRIDMTAPVDQQGDGAGGWRIRFFMPAGATLASLPVPNDPAVMLVDLPPERVAVLRYAGSTSASAVHEQEARLLRTLQGAGIAVSGAPFTWFYDPPWTLPPLRRNEAAVRLQPTP